MGMSTSSVSIVAIFFGAGLGALLRAWFNVLAESFSSTIPAGTLIANLLGAYLVGIALAYYMDQPTISP